MAKAQAPQERSGRPSPVRQGRPPFVERVRRERFGQIIEVWFQDEARIGQQGTLSTSWARTGSRPTAVKQAEFDWVYLYGAVCPATGESVGMIGGSVGIEWMNQHLAWISEHVRSSPGGNFVHVVLVLDRAGWHTSPKLKVPSNITLLPLPPYSPELNPVERLWLWMRSHNLSNRVFRDVDHLYEAATDAWSGLSMDRIKTLCRAPYMERKI